MTNEESEGRSLAVRESMAVHPAKAIGGIPHLNEYLALAGQIARTELVPEALRGRAESVLAVMMAGNELGIGPMQALQSINIIKGKPALSAELMRALVLGAGHQFIVDAGDTTATAKVCRAGWPEWQSVTFSLEDAKRAGLLNNPTWQKYPRAMLSARVTSEACRLYFPDVIAGMSYTPEEIEAFAVPAMTEQRPPMREVVAEAVKPMAVIRPFDNSGSAAAPADAPKPRASATKPCSEKQQGLIKKLLMELGFQDPASRGEYVRALAERDVQTTAELTSFEASKVIDALMTMTDTDSPEPVEAEIVEMAAYDERPF